MNIQALLALTAAVAYTPLLVIALNNRPWRKQHKLLFSFLIAAMLWSLGTALFRSYFVMEHKLLLGRVVLGILVVCGVQLHYLAHHFYDLRGFRFPTAYLLTLAVLVLVLTRVPEDVVISGKTIQPIYGIYAFPSLLFFYILLGRDIYLLRRTYHHTTELQKRNQISYLILGISTLLFFLSVSLTPVGKDIPVAHFGNLINAGILTYATLRHELLSIKFVARRTLAYSAAAIIISSLYLLLFSFLHYVLHLKSDFATVLVALLGTGILLGSFWYPMQRFVNRWVDRLFYGERLSYRQAIFQLSRWASSVLEVEDLGKELTRLVAGATGAKATYLLIHEAGKEGFTPNFVFPETEGSLLTGLKLREDSPVVHWLSREGRYLTRESLDILPEFASLWEEEKKAIESAGIELFLPLIARDRLAAILALTKPKLGTGYDIDDLNLLQVLSSQAAVMVDNALLYTRSQEAAENLDLINRLTRIIASAIDVREVYDKFMQELRKVMDADWASVAQIEGDQLRFFALSATASSAWKEGEAIVLEETGTAYVAKTKKTFVENDLLRHHKFWTGEVHLKHGIRSIVYLPLISKGECIGALVIGSRQPHAYGARQIALLEQLASQLATAVENFRLYAQCQSQAITDELTGVFNRRQFEERLAEEIDRHSRYGGTFSLVIFDLDMFKVYNDTYGHRAGDRLLKEIGQMVKETVRKVDLCFRYGGDEFALLLPETTVDEAYQVAERVRSLIAKEMEARKITVTASLGLASFPTDGLTGDEIVRAADAALYYAKQTGGNRVYLFSKITPAPSTKPATVPANELKTALSTVYALAAAVDAKDHYTYGHSRKVNTYAVALAEAAGLPADRIAVLSTAALLHDIGKIGVPDEVLRKPDKLNAQEWEALKLHSSIGATIVSYVPILAACVSIILHHHERHNGLGYPKELRGEAIPIESRILAIADAFDAITSSRPYREAKSVTEAIEELKRGSGTQFDPKLLELFIPIALSYVPQEVEVGKNPGSQPAESIE